MTRYDCPECGNGKLKREDGGWRCNGLADPGHPNLPLEACEYWVEKCVPCGACGGTGHVWVDFRGRYLGQFRSDDMDELESCPDCDGSGTSEECDSCIDGRQDFDPYEAAGESHFGLPGGGRSL